MSQAVLEGLRALGYQPESLLDVGAHVGRFAVDFRAIFPDCAPTLIEPNPHCEEALARLPFERHMVAASDQGGTAELFLTREWLQSTGSSLYRENTDFFRDEVVLRQEVAKVRLDDLLAGRRFDFVKIDTQGAELDVLVGGAAVLSQADYILLEVSLVDYNIGGATAEAVFAQLGAMGFRCAEVADFHRLAGVRDGALLQMDFLFERRAKRPTPATERLKGLGQSLAAEGRSDESLTVFEALVLLQPHDEEVLRALMAAYAQRGRQLEVLRLLARLRDQSSNPDTLLPEIQHHALAGVEAFNGYLAAGEVAQAETYAAALAALAPQNEAMLQAAMSCNQVLERWEVAGRYARALLTVNPRHPGALAALGQGAEVPSVPVDPEPAQIVDRMASALAPPPGTHRLLQLRDLHDVAGLILCRPLTEESLAQLQILLAAADALDVAVEAGSEWEGWLKHYRLLLAAVDMAAVLASTPDPLPRPTLSLATATGEATNWEGVRRTADRLGTKAVFYAAADEAYIDLYARWYGLSILKHADVPCLVILQVIGGAGCLADVAARVGIVDDRLIFVGDDFASDAVATKVYDAPPKGAIVHPVAHFQCARFLHLGGLLAQLQRPIFVSDIDLILQRGVADLLASTASQDVVFNENTLSQNAGSRLTANLMLVNPTQNALALLAFLESYLERQLAGPEVTRWIDQVGLVMARHHLMARGAVPRIGYFDTASDINNVMYPTFQDNPFRFLSLFHGFDTSSLERDAAPQT